MVRVWADRAQLCELEHVPAQLNRWIPMGARLGESVSTDSIGDRAMPTAYSKDIRGRVIARVESGGSRREAAEDFEVSPSTAVKWVKRFHDTGDCAAQPRGGSTSPLEKYADRLLMLISDQPDLTLD